MLIFESLNSCFVGNVLLAVYRSTRRSQLNRVIVGHSGRSTFRSRAFGFATKKLVISHLTTIFMDSHFIYVELAGGQISSVCSARIRGSGNERKMLHLDKLWIDLTTVAIANSNMSVEKRCASYNLVRFKFFTENDFLHENKEYISCQI